MIILKLTSRPSLSLLLCSTYFQYLGPTILLRTHILTYFCMISRTKYTKNVLVGSPAVLVRDEIHRNEYPGTRHSLPDGYPGSKISTRFNPKRDPVSPGHWCVKRTIHGIPNPLAFQQNYSRYDGPSESGSFFT